MFKKGEGKMYNSYWSMTIWKPIQVHVGKFLYSRSRQSSLIRAQFYSLEIYA